MYKNLILTKQDSSVALITINNPKTLNALNTSVLQDLSKVFDDLHNDQQIRAVVITGEGRAFVAGADIKEMAELNNEQGKQFGEFGAKVFRKIEQFRCPVIAAVNGFALGGGCELAMACDIRIAANDAKFAQPEVGLGIIPGFSGTQRLARLVGMGKAKELVYTIGVINANEALKINLVNSVVNTDETVSEAIKMAKTIAKQAPIAVKYAKEVMNKGFDLDIDQAIKLENDYFGKCFDTNDQKNGMRAFLNREKTEFEGN